MRIVLYVACLFLATSLNAQRLQDFSGTWHINPDKVVSKIYLPKTPPDAAPPIPPPPPPDHEYTLEQIRLAGHILKIAGGEPEPPPSIRLIPAATTSPIQPDAPDSVRTATHWHDGKLFTEWKMLRNGEESMQGTDTRSLAPGGQQIVERVIQSPQGRCAARAGKN